MKKLSEIKKEYNEFIEKIPDYITHVKKVLQTEKLNYAPDEIEKFQAFYERSYKAPSDIGLTKEKLENIFTAYIGTAWLWHFGGKWKIETNKKSEDYGFACIVEYGGEGYIWVAFAPLKWAIYGIELNQLQEPIKDSFLRTMDFYKNNPNFVLEPVRNIY